MSFTRYASLDQATVLEVKGSPTRSHTASLDRLSDFRDYRTDDNYLYVRLRAISSRVNKNSDGWPSVELAGSPEIMERHAKQSSTGFTVEAADGDSEYGFKTFVGKPNFIDHNNSDPDRARGVVVDAKLHVLPIEKIAASGDDYWTSASLDPEHAPPTEVELLLEIDAKSFPKYAFAVRSGDLDGFSMGCDVRESKCSHCGHRATNPDEYCSHILMKGAHHDYKTADGKRISRKSYENCYGISFFEISGVFDPADETALAREIRASVEDEGLTKIAENPLPQSFETTAPEEVDTMRQEHSCPVCFAPGTPVRAKRGFVPIEQIGLDDEVLTHTGKFARVLAKSKTPYQGSMVKFNSGLFPDPLIVTPNHPFRTLLHDTHTDCRPGICDKAISFPDTHRLGWACADHLDETSYVVAVAPKQTFDTDFVNVPDRFITSARKGPSKYELTPEFLWMVGLYLAEGNSHDREITFSLHSKETDYRDRIVRLFRSYGFNPSVVDRDGLPNARWINVASSTLAEWFANWLGSGCENKSIPADLLNLPNEKLSHVIQGVLDGDGCASRDSFGQTSSQLALQMVEFGHRVPRKVKPNVYRENPEGKKPVYRVHNASGSEILKPSDPQRNVRFGRSKWEFDGQPLHKILSKEEFDYDGPIYNLEVEGDHTYVVSGALVHNCGENMDGETCDICGYVEPPKGMDNPDLTKAKELQGDMAQGSQNEVQQDNAMAQGAQPVPEQAQGQPAPPPGGPQPNAKQPGSFLQTRKSGTSTSVMGDMRWQPKLNPKVAARIKQFEKPLLPGTTPATNDPATTTVVKNPQTPVTASMRTAQDLIEAANQNHTGDTMSTQKTADGPTGPEAAPDARVDATGVGGVIDPSNDAASKADKQVDVTGVGSTGVTDVEADKTESLPTASETSDDSGFDATKTTEDSGPTKTFGDSDGTEKAFTDPVTNESLESAKWGGGVSSARTAYDAKPFYDQPGLSGGTAVKGVQPVAEKFGERVDVLQATTTPENNSGPTSQWTGTDGNKVLRQQDPVTPESIATDGFTSHFVAGLKLADMEVDLGLIEKDAKYDRLAELSPQTDEEIGAQMDMLSRVKTAGTRKLAAKRTSGVTRMPSAFGRATASAKRFDSVISSDESEPVAEDTLDSALFSK